MRHYSANVVRVRKRDEWSAAFPYLCRVADVRGSSLLEVVVVLGLAATLMPPFYSLLLQELAVAQHWVQRVKVERDAIRLFSWMQADLQGTRSNSEAADGMLLSLGVCGESQVVLRLSYGLPGTSATGQFPEVVYQWANSAGGSERRLERRGVDGTREVVWSGPTRSSGAEFQLSPIEGPPRGLDVVLRVPDVGAAPRQDHRGEGAAEGELIFQRYFALSQADRSGPTFPITAC